jgi:opacity protein-like surface antigen
VLLEFNRLAVGTLVASVARITEEEQMSRSVVSKKVLGFVAVIVALAASSSTAFAQVEQPSQVSIQGTALVTKSSTDQIPSNDVTKSGGFLVGYSYQFNKWLGAEGNYGYSRNTNNFTTFGGLSSLENDFHEVTGALLAHIPVSVRGIRPYVLGGGGALVFDPTDKFTITGAERQTRGTFVYGGGANFDITSNFGLRAEYRGLVYKVPDFNVNAINLDKFTHLAQPSFGFYFRF